MNEPPIFLFEELENPLSFCLGELQRKRTHALALSVGGVEANWHANRGAPLTLKPKSSELVRYQNYTEVDELALTVLF